MDKHINESKPVASALGKTTRDDKVNFNLCKQEVRDCQCVRKRCHKKEWLLCIACDLSSVRLIKYIHIAKMQVWGVFFCGIHKYDFVKLRITTHKVFDVYTLHERQYFNSRYETILALLGRRSKRKVHAFMWPFVLLLVNAPSI